MARTIVVRPTDLPRETDPTPSSVTAGVIDLAVMAA